MSFCICVLVCFILPNCVLIVFQLIERTAVDHPHHTLFILLALANAEKDDKYLTAGKKNTSRLTRNNSKGGAKGFTEVSNLS